MTDAAVIFADAHADLVSALGTDATVQRGSDAAVSVRVVVHDGVAKVGQYGQVVGRNTHIDFTRSEWNPARGDLLTYVDPVTSVVTSRKVDAIDTDDGIIVRAVLHG